MNKSLSRRAFLRTSIASGASLAAAAAGAAPAGIYRPGTYSAKASGIGEVTVTMTFDANRIIDVVLDVSHETPGIGQAAADTLKKNLTAAVNRSRLWIRAPCIRILKRVSFPACAGWN